MAATNYPATSSTVPSHVIPDEPCPVLSDQEGEEVPQSPRRNRRARESALECATTEGSVERAPKLPHPLVANAEDEGQPDTASSCELCAAVHGVSSRQDQSGVQADSSQAEQGVRGVNPNESDKQEQCPDGSPSAGLRDLDGASNSPSPQIRQASEQEDPAEDALVASEEGVADETEPEESEIEQEDGEASEEDYDADAETGGEDDLEGDELLYWANFSNIYGENSGMQDLRELAGGQEAAAIDADRFDESESDAVPACQHSRQRVDLWFAENVNVSESTVATEADRQEDGGVADDEEEQNMEPRNPIVYQ